VQVVGLLLAVTGIVATVAAQLSMGDSWRVGVDESERTALVTVGAFRLVRNPIFTAMICTAGGLALMVGNLIAVLGAVALIVAVQLQVRAVEEPYLRRLHAGSYTSYTAAGGRFLPGVGRQHP
jgi:protein-S-isoprenylcysteine O-methyltransferase Ste14